MTWLTWRQHRAQLVAAAGVLAVLGAFLLWTRHSLNTYQQSAGLPSCVASGGDCQAISAQIRSHFQRLFDYIGYLNFLPLILGMFWGAPLVAREIEQGTHRLAWTQSVSRRRWLGVKLVALLCATGAVSVAFAGLMTWWFKPVELMASGDGDAYSRINPNAYNFQGIVPIGYGVAALAIGVCSGVVLRRTLAAMAVTVAVWLPFRLWFESIRGDLLAPLSVSYPAFGTSPRANTGDWVMHSNLVDGVGHIVRDPFTLCPQKSRGPFDHCAAVHGLQSVDLYHPASQFWALQGIEFGVYAAVSGLLLGFAYYWLTRRRALI
jgi:hypothetical protein